MKGWRSVGLVAAVAALLGIWALGPFFRKPESPEAPTVAEADESSDAEPRSEHGAATDPDDSVSPPDRRSALEPGDAVDDSFSPRLLRHYGAEGRTAREDLALVEETLQRFWLYFKDPDLIRFGSNEDVMSTLLGRNPEGVAYVSPENPFVDEGGRLLDRWGEPLFFHAESVTRVEIRSSGPDRDMFSEDDIVTVAVSHVAPKR